MEKRLWMTKAREAKGWSRKELAFVADVSYRSIVGYENGNTLITVTRAMKVAKFLGVPWTLFFADDAPPVPLGQTDYENGPRPWLKDIRKKQKIKAKDLEDKLYFSRGYVTQIENGNVNVTVPRAMDLGEVLGFPWTWFFREKEE